MTDHEPPTITDEDARYAYALMEAMLWHLEWCREEEEPTYTRLYSCAHQLHDKLSRLAEAAKVQP